MSEGLIARGEGTEQSLAEAMMGRLLLTTAPQEGADIEAMTEKLKQTPVFAALKQKAPQEQLKALQSGRFLQEPERKQPSAEKPAKDITPPEAYGPSM